MLPWVRAGSNGFFWVIQSFISCLSENSPSIHVGQRFAEWGALLCSLWHPWPHAGWCSLHSGYSASAPSMLLLGSPEVWGWYDWLVFSQSGLRPRFLSGDLAPGGWLQLGFRAACSYLGISAKLVNIQLLLLQPSSCQQEPINSASSECQGRLQRASFRLFLSVWWPHMPCRPVSPTFTNRVRLLSLSSISVCPPEPASQGEEAGLSLSSPPSLPSPLTPSPVLSTLFHLSNPSFHPSTSFLILLPYTKPQDQVIRSGSSYVNRTNRNLEKLFFVFNEIRFSCLQQNKNKNIKILFWFSEAKQWIFFFAFLPQKCSSTPPPLPTSPSLKILNRKVQY